MTNNGMETESDRAMRLSKTLDLDISPNAMIMCHSALKVSIIHTFLNITQHLV